MNNNQTPAGQPLEGLERLRQLYSDKSTLHRATEQRGNFRRGLSAGVDQAQALGFGAVAAVADVVGADRLTDAALDGYRRNIDEAELSAPDIARIEDASSLSDYTAWAAYTLGSQLPILASIVGTGGAGAVAGAAGTAVARKAGVKFLERNIAKQAAKLSATGMAEGEALRLGAKIVSRQAAKTTAKAAGYGGGIALETGSIFGDISETTGELRGGVALSFGSVAGLLEAAPVLRLFKRSGIGAQQATEGILANARRIAKNVAKGSSKQAAIEGTTEGLQTVIEQAAVDYVEQNLGSFTPEDMSEILNAVVAGAFIGGTIAAPGSLLESRRRKLDDDITAANTPEKRKAAAAAAEQQINDIREEAINRAGDGDPNAASVAAEQIRSIRESIKGIDLDLEVDTDVDSTGSQQSIPGSDNASITPTPVESVDESIPVADNAALDNPPGGTLQLDDDDADALDIPQSDTALVRGDNPPGGTLQLDDADALDIPQSDTALVRGDNPAVTTEQAGGTPTPNALRDALGEEPAGANTPDPDSLVSDRGQTSANPGINDLIAADAASLVGADNTPRANTASPPPASLDAISTIEEAFNPPRQLDAQAGNNAPAALPAPSTTVNPPRQLDAQAANNAPAALPAPSTTVDTQAGDIVANNGKPYKTRKAASRRLVRGGYTGTHNIQAIGSGFGLRPIPIEQSTDTQNEFGQDNAVFTTENADAARERLRTSLAEKAAEQQNTTDSTNLNQNAPPQSTHQTAPPESPGTPPPPADVITPEFGKKNTLFTEDAAAAARERIRKKFAGGTVSSGFDPQFATDGATLAGYYIEGGLRKFDDYARAIINDFGDDAIPWLSYWYESVRRYPGFDAKDMTPSSKIDSLMVKYQSNEPAESTSSTDQFTLPEKESDTGTESAKKGPGLHDQLDHAPADQNSVGTEAPGDVSVASSPESTGPAGNGGARPNVGEGRTTPPTGNSGLKEPGDIRNNDARGRVTPDFHTTDPLSVVGGTPVQRYNKNRAAIELLNNLDDTQATAEQQTVLAGFTGWGSFGQELFNGTWDNPKPAEGWTERSDWLREHLGEAAWKSAQRSIINAHYTDPPTVTAMWEMVERLGFSGGRVLEPSMGTGNFFSMMPKSLQKASTLTGVELDATTGAIAKQLFPNSQIHIKPYQKHTVPDGFYDLVIGNWPFENTVVASRRYNKVKPHLHDFFFLKALDQARPGALVVGITSKGTLDKLNPAVRRELAKKAELISATRLPSGAFKDYAGTSVVTDIIILRKRVSPVANPTDAWIKTAPFDTPQGEPVVLNQFYHNNPDQVVGKIEYGSGMYGNSMIVVRPDDVEGHLKRIISTLPENLISSDGTSAPITTYLSDHLDDRYGALNVNSDGSFIVNQGSVSVLASDIVKYPVKAPKSIQAFEKQLSSLIELRTLYGKMMQSEQSTGDAGPQRTALKKAYTAFYRAHGAINDSRALRYLVRLEEPHAALLQSLETRHKGKWRPARVLTVSTLKRTTKVSQPSAAEALVLLRNKSTSVSPAAVAKLANSDEASVTKTLVDSGAVHLDQGQLVPTDVFLSGDVRAKYKRAQAAVDAHNNENAAELYHLQVNAEALKAAIPADVPYYNINARLGAPWVDTAVFEQYVAHMLGMDSTEGITVRLNAVGVWTAQLSEAVRKRPETNTNYGMAHYNVGFKRLLNAALSNTTFVVKDDEKHTDIAATEQAVEAIDRIREDFADWAWQDPARRIALEKQYNERMNALALPTFDGSFMQMDGMALTIGESDFNLRKHQLDAVWRGVANRRSMNAHEVGTGKSFVIAGIAVESRRYGIANKPLILAHNANSRAVAKDINIMYPGAKVLYIDNLAPKNINRRLHQIANDDWDAIVMPHSLIDRLSFKEETLVAMAEEQIERLEFEAKEAAIEDGAKLTPAMLNDPEELAKLRSPTAKDMVKNRNRILENIKKQAQISSRPGAIAFEDLGIDMVMVDEVHAFKKPPFVTRMRMKGLQTQVSTRSIALQYITQYVASKNGGTNVHTFSGTIMTNTLTEIYHQMRYVMLDDMVAAGVDNWDSFFAAFASEVQDVEVTATGEYEPITRLAAFINVPELRQLVGQYMDVVFGEDMPELQPRKTSSGKIMTDELSAAELAELQNGRTENAADRPYKKVINVISEMSQEQVDKLNELRGYAKEWREANGKQRREWQLAGNPRSPIITENLADKASFDTRLLHDSNAGGEGSIDIEPNSKAAQVVANVVEIYNSHAKASQVVFMGRGINSKASRSSGLPGAKVQTSYDVFSTMQDVIERLVQKGIPREQIATITASTSKEQRMDIANGMNNLSVRVVLGSISSMGVGVNMQKNLRAMHHMDAPWMPGDLEQANGRGWRQGNQWNTVLEHRYITDKLDGRRWQVLALKQRFITEFLRSNADIREIEGDSVSDTQSDILESFGSAAGDPRILLRATMDKKIDKYQRKERTYSRAISDSSNQISVLKHTLKSADTNISEAERLAALGVSLLGKTKEKFAATIDGTRYEKRLDANNAIQAWIADNVVGSKAQSIGDLNGVELTVDQSRLAEKPTIRLNWVVDGESVRVHSDSKKPINSLENNLRTIVKSPAKLKAKRAEMAESLDRLENISSEPFAFATELKAAIEKKELIEQDLIDNPEPPPPWLIQGAPVDTTVVWKGETLVVSGHAKIQGNLTILSENDKGQISIPVAEATDAQGFRLFDLTPDGQLKQAAALLISNRPGQRPGRRSRSDKIAKMQVIADKLAHRLIPIHVVTELPSGLAAEINEQGVSGWVALYSQGQIFVNAQQIKSRHDLEVAVAHEQQHALFRLLLNEKGASNTVDRLINGFGGISGIMKLARENNIDLRQYLQSNNKEVEAGYLPPRAAVLKLIDELLAFKAMQKQSTLQQTWQRLMRLVRKSLRKVGFVRLAASPQGLLMDTLYDSSRASITTASVRRLRTRADVAFMTISDAGASDAPADAYDMQRRVAELLNRQPDARAGAFEKLKKSSIRAIRKFKAGTAREALGLLTRRMLVETGEKLLPRMRDYLKLADERDATRRDLHAIAATISSKWSGIKDDQKDRLANVIHASTLSGLDPTVEFADKDDGVRSNRYSREEQRARKSTYAQIRREWDALDDTSQAVYIEARDYFSTQSDQYIEALGEQIMSQAGPQSAKEKLWASIKQTFESNRLQGPYFPLSRFGRYWVVTGDITDPDYRVDRFETLAEQKTHIEQMRDQGFDVRAGSELDELAKIEGVPASFVKDVDALIEKTELSDEQAAALRDNIYQIFLESLPDVTARKHFIHRQNIRGFSNDALRAFSDSAFKGSNLVANAKFLYQLDDVVESLKLDINSTDAASQIADLEKLRDQLHTHRDDIRQALFPGVVNLSAAQIRELDKYGELADAFLTTEAIERQLASLHTRAATQQQLLNDPGQAASAADFYNELLSSHERLKNPPHSPVAIALNGLGFGFYLGFTPAAAMVNLTQVPLVTLPLLGARYGHRKAAAALHTANKQFFGKDKAGERSYSVFAQLSDKEKAAYTEFARLGAIDVTQAHDLVGLAEDGADYNSVSFKIRKAMSFSFHHAERLNREVTLISSYRLAIDAGKTHREAIQEAVDMTWRSQFDYGGTNRARYFAGNWMRVLTQFKQYSAGITYLYVDTFRKAFKDADPATRAEAKRALKSLLAIQFAFTGLLGLPLARTVLPALVSAFSDDDDLDYETSIRLALRDMLETMSFGALGSRTATALTKGAFDGFTPISLHGRLSISELWMREPYRELEGRDQWTHVLKQIAGPSAAIAEGLFVGANLISEGNIQRGLEMMLPKAARDVVKAGRYINENARTLSGDNEIATVRFDEAIIQAIGFSPSSLTQAYDQRGAKQFTQARISRRRSQLLRDVFKAQGDLKEMRDVRRRVAEFNLKYPEYSIRAKTIKRSLSSRRRANEQTVGGFRGRSGLQSTLDRIEF